MARFRATVQGQRGQASRLGGKKSGMSAIVNGWDRGVQVHAFVDPETGLDTFEVVLTGGSSGSCQPRIVGRYI